MKVDSSPNLPPISSWTTAAPAGSGVDGGGSSIWSRSMRRITAGPPGESLVRRLLFGGPNQRGWPGNLAGVLLTRLRGGSGLVPGLHPLRAVEGELVGVGPALRQHRLEQDRVVIAGVEPVEHAADEAVR